MHIHACLHLHTHMHTSILINQGSSRFNMSDFLIYTRMNKYNAPILMERKKEGKIVENVFFS